MGLDELIILGVMLLAIVGSWIGNLIKEAQQKQAEKEREARGESTTNVDDAVAQRRERLRQMARERQERAERTQREYQRYGELESTGGGETYSRYGQIDDATRAGGYQRYEDANAEALEQYARHREPGQHRGGPTQPEGTQRSDYQRYRQTQQRTPRDVNEQLRSQSIRRGESQGAGTGQATRGQSGGRSGGHAPQRGAPAGSSRSTQTATDSSSSARDHGTGAPSHEEVAGAMQRDARMRQPVTTRMITTAEAPEGQPTAAAKRIRRRLTSASVREFFIIKELFDKPMGMRDQLGINEW